MDAKYFYFIGAGGIGMSALVRYFLYKGYKVGGYDRTPTPLTEKLIEEGAEIHYEDNIELIPEKYKDAENTLVIVTPAIPHTHSELRYFKENDFTIEKRSEVLGDVTRESKALCVAGTHGKTTTSTMIAHLFYNSHLQCNAFLGGISKNYKSNLLLSNKSSYTVIEADEFDRSFHHLSPYMSIITSVEPDHLDIYKTEEEYYKSFQHYISLINDEGALIIKDGLDLNVSEVKAKVYTYSKDKGDFHAENIEIKDGNIYLDFVGPDVHIKKIKLGTPIYINIENSVAAMAVAHLNKLTEKEIRKGVETFKGISRRFDFKIKEKELIFLSDYAHHPSEIKQSIASLRKLYSNKKITVIFQPHLFSRTQSFYKEFAKSLSLADEVILTDIYPAREEPIPGVDSSIIYNEITSPEKLLCKKEEILDLLKKKDIDVLMVLGAGDIDNYSTIIKKVLLEKKSITPNLM